MPTEAEWEYAARGGLVGKCYLWGDEASTSDIANYGGTVRTTTVAGSYPANGHSLYDMAGNVVEWCADWYSSDYYSKSPAKNPLGPGRGKYPVLRGGNWDYGTYGLRLTYRSYYGPPNYGYLYYGFRCVSRSP